MQILRCCGQLHACVSLCSWDLGKWYPFRIPIWSRDELVFWGHLHGQSFTPYLYASHPGSFKDWPVQARHFPIHWSHKLCICPVSAVLSFMVARGHAAGPLFLWKDVCYLNWDRFVAKIRKVRLGVGLKPKEYAGHSFRISAATMAVQIGLQDSLIKTLGCWQSLAYTLYIKTLRPQRNKLYCETSRKTWIKSSKDSFDEEEIIGRETCRTSKKSPSL